MSVGVLLRSVFSALFVGFAVYFVSRALGTPHILPGVVVGVALVVFLNLRPKRWFERWLDQ